MSKKVFVLRIAGIFSFLLYCTAGLAVETREIDAVRAKSVLNEGDLRIIDKFIYDAVSEIVNSKDFTSVARTRAVLLSRQSDQAQYAAQYSKSCREHIGRALEQSRRIGSDSDRAVIQMNLLILIDNLEDARLADLAIDALANESTVVRYWAVHVLTRPGLYEKLDSQSNDSELKREIISSLEDVLEKASPEEMNLIINFAGSVNSYETEQLILKITDFRLEKYSEWSVKEYLTDINLLKALYSKMVGTGSREEAAQYGSGFCQLYSYAMQVYIKNISGTDFLTPVQKQQLASVLVEIEDKCIGKLTGLQQTVIKTAVENDDAAGLIIEHSRLLGDETNAGVIPGKFGFGYGLTADGNRLTKPKVLPEGPNDLRSNG